MWCKGMGALASADDSISGELKHPCISYSPFQNRWHAWLLACPWKPPGLPVDPIGMAVADTPAGAHAHVGKVHTHLKS